jgi:hypothetical protein
MKESEEVEEKCSWLPVVICYGETEKFSASVEVLIMNLTEHF